MQTNSKVPKIIKFSIKRGIFDTPKHMHNVAIAVTSTRKSSGRVGSPKDTETENGQQNNQIDSRIFHILPQGRSDLGSFKPKEK